MKSKAQTKAVNCTTCGRFVGYQGSLGVVYDEYLGGWEWDPMCHVCSPIPQRQEAVCYCNFHLVGYHAEWCESIIGKENKGG